MYGLLQAAGAWGLWFLTRVIQAVSDQGTSWVVPFTLFLGFIAHLLVSDYNLFTLWMFSFIMISWTQGLSNLNAILEHIIQSFIHLINIYWASAMCQSLS